MPAWTLSCDPPPKEKRRSSLFIDRVKPNFTAIARLFGDTDHDGFRSAAIQQVKRKFHFTMKGLGGRGRAIPFRQVRVLREPILAKTVDSVPCSFGAKM